MSGECNKDVRFLTLFDSQETLQFTNPRSMAANEVSRFLVKDGMAVNGRYILCLYEVNILHCFVLFFSMPFLCLEEGCARYGKDVPRQRV